MNNTFTYVHKNDVESVKKLIESNEIDIEYRDTCGNTLLHLSIMSKSLDVFKYLIDIGVDIETKNNYGKTPLHKAMMYKNIEVIKRLLEHDANINKKDYYGYTPMDYYINKEEILNLMRLTKLNKIYGK